MRTALFALLILGLAGCSQESRPVAMQKDNSAINVRDRDGSTLTPVDQSQAQGDLNLTAKIRQEILAKDGLSVNARNIKIVTQEGKVTLRGPVTTQEEKDRIDAIARQAAGDKQVENLLEINSP
jgi:hyperosmotically inducible protein